MGHLFYNELGGTVFSSILSSGDLDLALFSNIQSFVYWSGTEFAPFPLVAWVFGFNDGNQRVNFKGRNLHVWTLRSGDVAAAPAPVPETGTIFFRGWSSRIGAVSQAETSGTGSKD